jgi:hypothetical protein
LAEPENEESEMTLTTESEARTRSVAQGCGESADRVNRCGHRRGLQLDALREACPHQCFSADQARSLLEEPAIAQWASEAATEYEVSTTDALELLAFALFVDGQK